MILNRSNIINNYTEYFPFVVKSHLLNYDELSINQFKSNHAIPYITGIIDLYELLVQNIMNQQSWVRWVGRETTLSSWLYETKAGNEYSSDGKSYDKMIYLPCQPNTPMYRGSGNYLFWGQKYTNVSLKTGLFTALWLRIPDIPTMACVLSIVLLMLTGCSYFWLTPSKQMLVIILIHTICCNRPEGPFIINDCSYPEGPFIVYDFFTRCFIKKCCKTINTSSFIPRWYIPFGIYLSIKATWEKGINQNECNPVYHQ